MSIIDRIILTSEAKGIKQDDICSSLQISSSTFSTWKSKRRDPPAKYIPRICELMGVSTDYILTGEEPTTPQNTADREQLDIIERLSPEEQRYIERFLMLSETDKVRIMERIDTLLESYPAEVKEVI